MPIFLPCCSVMRMRRKRKASFTRFFLNEEVAAITTPYFKFYELEALAKLGRFEVVMDTLKSYWGGMLERVGYLLGGIQAGTAGGRAVRHVRG